MQLRPYRQRTRRGRYCCMALIVWDFLIPSVLTVLIWFLFSFVYSLLGFFSSFSTFISFVGLMYSLVVRHILTVICACPSVCCRSGVPLSMTDQAWHSERKIVICVFVSRTKRFWLPANLPLSLILATIFEQFSLICVDCESNEIPLGPELCGRKIYSIFHLYRIDFCANLFANRERRRNYQTLN